ncbi:hypothetical protein LCGC14_1041610, partial [marine sediment metagenome]
MFFGGVMALSWVQYAYAAFNADVQNEQFFNAGPLSGASVLRSVRIWLALN